MSVIRSLRRAAGMTQTELAKAGGTSQPTIAAYEAATKSPTVGTVERLARGVGLEAHVSFHPPLTREDRRSLAIHAAIALKLQSDPGPVLQQARQTLARMRAVASPDAQPIREWEVLLARPLPALLEILLDPSPWARELRHVTPFAGVLSAAERRQALAVFAAAERGARRP